MSKHIIAFETLDGFLIEEPSEAAPKNPVIYRAIRNNRTGIFNSTLDERAIVVPARTYKYYRHYPKGDTTIYVYREEDASKLIKRFKRIDKNEFPNMGEIVFCLATYNQKYRTYDQPILIPCWLDNPRSVRFKSDIDKKVWVNFGGYESEVEHYPLWCNPSDLPTVETDGNGEFMEEIIRVGKDAKRSRAEKEIKILSEKISMLQAKQ